MNLNEKLNWIQTNLKAPKNQNNDFGHYKYRSCEDILEALKPLLKEAMASLIITDDIRTRGGGSRFYVVSTATLLDSESEERISVNSFAREPESQKGMGDAQITGSASSYARKYALNGLFLIDDTKDDDSKEPPKVETPKKVEPKKDPVDKFNEDLDNDIKVEELINADQKGKIKGLLLELKQTPEYLEEKIKKSIDELSREEAGKIIKGMAVKLLNKAKGKQ